MLFLWWCFRVVLMGVLGTLLRVVAVVFLRGVFRWVFISGVYYFVVVGVAVCVDVCEDCSDEAVDWGDVVVEVELSSASIEEKLAAVLLCFARGGLYTVKSVRTCACMHVSVGDKMVGRIVRFLAEIGLVCYDSRVRRWHATPAAPRIASYEDALGVASRLASEYRHLLVRLRHM